MDIHKLSPFLSVSPQVRTADVAELARLGFKAIINNRPDGESEDQPTHEELAAKLAEVHDGFKISVLVSLPAAEAPVVGAAKAVRPVRTKCGSKRCARSCTPSNC